VGRISQDYFYSSYNTTKRTDTMEFEEDLGPLKESFTSLVRPLMDDLDIDSIKVICGEFNVRLYGYDVSRGLVGIKYFFDFSCGCYFGSVNENKEEEYE
jgi:hypothetical protein